MVIPRFVERALRGEPLLIYGTGKQSRCFACVDDILDGAIALMDCEQAPGRVYNLGATEEITIEALADKIIERTGSQSEKKYVSYEQAYGRPFDDMMRRVPCTERARSLVGFAPKTSLDEILDPIIRDMRTRLEAGG